MFPFSLLVHGKVTMSTKKIFLLKSHFNKMFLSQFMTWFVCSLWGFLCWFVFKIFYFLEKYIDSRIVDGDDFSAINSQKDEQLDCKSNNRLELFVQSKYEYKSGQDYFGFMEKPEIKSFSVQEMFVNFNEGGGVRMVEKEEIDKCSDDHSPNSKEKLFYFSFFNDGISGHQEHVHKSQIKEKAKEEIFDEVNDQEKTKGHVENLCCEVILEQNDEVFSDEETQNSKDISYEIQLLQENQSLCRNSSQGSDANGDEDLITSDELCSEEHLNGFLNIDQFMEVDREENDDMGFIELESSIATDEFASKNGDTVEEINVNYEEMKLMNDLQEFSGHNSSRKSWDIDEFASKNVDSVDEKDVNYEEMKLMNDLQEFSGHNSSRKSWDIDEFASKNVDSVEEKDVNYEEMKLMDDLQEFSDHNSCRKSWDIDEFASKNVDSVEEKDVNYEEMKLMDDLQEFSDHNSCRKSWDTDSDDEDGCHILLEHQNLVRQMKMKNSRIAGLPTISEDCESTKVVEDLKPLKIDEKIEYKDRMEEIQKFYKRYAEKMRKLDILNYQTLNAISFLQLKDSEVFMSSKKSSISITKAFTLPSFLANKQRKIFADPAQKSISEMNRDLEIVYVGQICLSWEILCWQYGKSKELLEHDPHEYHTYNQVAGEYQQFQVLLQRFVEDEPFQGPRVQHYVRKRCILRNFLQVPSIRDDRSKEKQGKHEGEKYIISIVKLAEIIKETMQVFWEFLRADKREANLSLKGVQGTQMDTAEIELFMNVKLDLQKKERKLKDVQRSGNCIVKKFQKQQQGRLSHSVFASLVELKLLEIWKFIPMSGLSLSHL